MASSQLTTALKVQNNRDFSLKQQVFGRWGLLTVSSRLLILSENFRAIHKSWCILPLRFGIFICLTFRLESCLSVALVYQPIRLSGIRKPIEERRPLNGRKGAKKKMLKELAEGL